jgi:integrase
MARLLGRPVERFTLHDLRRTAATEMAEMGIAVHVIDKLLNHKTGTIRGIAKVYNRHEYRPEQRDALVRWGRRLAAIVGDGDPVQVLDFPGRGVA